MKALDKDMAQRYESRMHRFGRLVRRNKPVFAAGGGVAAALVLGGLMAACQRREAVNARDRIDEAANSPELKPAAEITVEPSAQGSPSLSPESQLSREDRMKEEAEEAVLETRKSKGAGAKETLAACRRLARILDATGHSDEALGVLRQASIDAPQDTLLANEVAALQVWLGKNEDYLDTCRRIIAYAESATNDRTIAQRRAAKICSLRAHNDSALIDQALVLVRRGAMTPGAEVDLWQHVLGMAEFRAGNDENAEKALSMAKMASTSKTQHIQGPIQLFRAMILFRRGNTTEALALFAEAEALMKPLPREKRGVLPVGATRDDLQFWIAYEEAKAMIKPVKEVKPHIERGYPNTSGVR